MHTYWLQVYQLELDSDSIGTSGSKVGIHVPSMTSVVQQELPAMLASPKSWSMTLVVVLIYTYVM